MEAATPGQDGLDSPSPALLLTGRPAPSVGEIFRGFFSIGVTGFGGVLPWARRMVVDQRRWLTSDEFVDALAMCQFIPGPNIVNLSVALGSRFQGPAGALAGVVGIMAAPMVIIIVAYLLLEHVADDPVVIGAVHGMSAAAAGLIVAMAVKIAMPMLRRRDVWGTIIALVAIGAVAVLRLPLVATLLVLAPVAVIGEKVRQR